MDPRKRVQPGDPFRPSASAWNLMLDAARQQDAGGGPGFGAAPPNLLVRVRNDTGATLPVFSVVKLGASALDVTVPLRVAPTPMFAGTTPAAATDAFAVLLEPAPTGRFALAAVSGVVPVEVAIGDATHGYAVPGATVARLTSAATGPVRILDRETGTGNKKAVVLLGGSEIGGILKGKLDGALTAGGSAVMSVWRWNGSADVDTGDNVTVTCWVLKTGQSIAIGTFVDAAWDSRSGRYEVIAAACP